MFVFLSFCFSVSLSLSSVCFFPSLCLSPPVSVSVCLNVCLSFCFTVFPCQFCLLLSLSLSLPSSLCLSKCFLFSLSVSASFSLSSVSFAFSVLLFSATGSSCSVRAYSLSPRDSYCSREITVIVKTFPTEKTNYADPWMGFSGIVDEPRTDTCQCLAYAYSG